MHRQLLEEYGVFRQAHSRFRPAVWGKAKVIHQALASAFHHNPFLVGRRELLFFGHERRKMGKDGKQWDIYCDPIIDALDRSYVCYESPYLGGHLIPAKTEQLRYLDLALLVGSIRKRFLVSHYHSAGQDMQDLRDIETDWRKRFSTGVNLVQKVEEVLRRREALLPVYETVLKRVNPRLVLLVVSYGKEDFIEACRRHNVPTVELQHGVLHRYHMGYSFPNEARKHFFPNYFFAFGEYWSRVADLPIAAERVFLVGFPYLQEEAKRFADIVERQQILFISQGTIGPELSKLAVSLRSLLPSDWRIVYKLHPGEYARWQRTYPWLAAAEGIGTVDRSPSLYRLFAESYAQVGVYSTALIEGLAFDLRTYLADLPGVDIMAHLNEAGIASRVSTAEELASGIKSEQAGTRFDDTAFFAPGSRSNVRNAVSLLLDS